MKVNILNKLLVVLLLVVATGCKTRKMASTTPPEATEPAAAPAFSTSEVVGNIQAKQAKFNTLAIKAKAQLNINNNSNDVSMNIRIKDGETIWVSVTALAGLEVARALLTPDSIKVLNRMQSQYTKKPFSFIHQFSNQQVDFKTVQSLLIGNVIPGTVSNSSVIEMKEGKFEVSGNLMDILYKAIFNPAYNLVANNLENKNIGQNLLIRYDDFRNISGQDIPHTVNISSTAPGSTLSVDLKYNQISMNEALEFPFNVPKRFTVKN